jgi:ABC-type multidrug transport system permease subunit
MAGLSLGITAHVRDIDAYNLVMALFFSTMYISGAFFPLEVLPVWLQIPARALPLTESIELTRAFLTGRFLARHVYEGILSVNISRHRVRMGNAESATENGRIRFSH